MLFNNNIINYILYKLKNNYKDYNFNNNNNIKNIFYRGICNTNLLQTYAVDIKYHKITKVISIDIIFNDYTKMHDPNDLIFFKKIYFFNYKYWILLKYINLVKKYKSNNIKNIIEKTDIFFNDKELRNLKIKDLV